MSKVSAPRRENYFESFYNIIAKVVTPLFMSLTPNQVTLISGIFGVIGAILLAFHESYNCLVLSVLLIQIYTVLDLVDGNIARAKKMSSKFGQWLDVFFDKLNDFLIIFGLSYSCFKIQNDERYLIGGITLMGCIFFSQFIMVITREMSKSVIQNSETVDSGESVISGKKEFFRKVVMHTTLGHSTFLFLVGLFSLLNILNYGFFFLVVHSIYTLLVLVLVNFYKFRNS